MIHLLFTLILAEMALVLTLTFRTPVRKLVIMGLDQLKKGRGLVMMQTVAGTMLVVFASIIHSIMKVQKRLMDAGSVNPTDQVLMANHLLEGSLMGFSLFLALVIDRLHYYIKELHLLRTSLEAVKALEEETSALRNRNPKQS
ncbi:hypothetical protein L1049_000880 [Liquidambar formosana]|uniref:Endoplasmic reticulum transmembrane protein n=1 Tax=Liquidambar formosana TaxID=63359 RepID=A0AAP0NBA5_LIQFO